ncbi:hypothetical protein [Kitasatospora griseola]|uniref:hypothetical protein n=1 Tax=Kitasatospora griseola TaxID=2064 RepID=UPI003443FB9C
MNAWIFTCNSDDLDLLAFHRDGHELRSWTVDRYQEQLVAGDPFCLWLLGRDGGVIASGRLTGLANQRTSDLTLRWHVPLAIDEWLDRPVSRDRLAHALVGSSMMTEPSVAGVHRLDDAQWSAIEDILAEPPQEDLEWHLRPGDTIRRTELHKRYGGSGQGGISPSAKSQNVFLFTDPKSGRQHGYYDEWDEDGTFHYTGQGKQGDQAFIINNKAVRDHVQMGRRLRLFEGSRKTVRYVGEVALDPVVPYSIGEAPAAGTDQLRRVIRFHMVRVGATVQRADVQVGAGYRPANEDIVPEHAVPAQQDPDLNRRNLQMHRSLQNNLAQQVTNRGMTPLSPTAADPDFDLAWRDLDGNLTVCEVKSLTNTNEVRQLRAGLGQVLDYHDQLQHRAADVHPVLWVEREPTDPRWLGLCARVGITLGWPGHEDRIFRAAGDTWPHTTDAEPHGSAAANE